MFYFTCDRSFTDWTVLSSLFIAPVVRLYDGLAKGVRNGSGRYNSCVNLIFGLGKGPQALRSTNVVVVVVLFVVFVIPVVIRFSIP